MTARDRRAARELRGYLERLYGPQLSMILVPGDTVSSERVLLHADGIVPCLPAAADDCQTQGPGSFDHCLLPHRPRRRVCGRGARLRRGDQAAPGGKAPRRGLAVPGMPLGSPGMEVEGMESDVYEVLRFGPQGRPRFVRYRGGELA